MKKKVLFFLPSSVGGAERMTITMAKMLPSDTFEVKFVVVHRNLGAILNFIPDTYEVIHIPVYNIYCFSTFRIFNVIRKEKPYAVFSSLLYLNARVIIAAKLFGCRVVVRNNIDIGKTTSKSAPLLVKLTYRWADMVVAQQDEMRNEIVAFTGLPEGKVRTINNPLDVEFIQNKLKEQSPFDDINGQIKYVCVGRFSPQKGQDVIVKAFKSVRSKLSNAHLYLVGKYDLNSSYDKDVKTFIDNNHMNEYVHMVGFQNNPYKWVKYCDYYVMPSRLEGLPNSLIDAMYIGKPVVATTCIPVIERIVKDGYNGVLVEADNCESLANGMLNVLCLKDFKMTYQPAESKDVIALFS